MVRRSMRQWQLAAILLVVVAGGSGYFVYHAYHGRLGLMARGELIRRIAELKNEHGLVRSERALWERRVGLLSADKLDPDFSRSRPGTPLTGLMATTLSSLSAMRIRRSRASIPPLGAIQNELAQEGQFVKACKDL